MKTAFCYMYMYLNLHIRIKYYLILIFILNLIFKARDYVKTIAIRFSGSFLDLSSLIVFLFTVCVQGNPVNDARPTFQLLIMFYCFV